MGIVLFALKWLRILREIASLQESNRNPISDLAFICTSNYRNANAETPKIDGNRTDQWVEWGSGRLAGKISWKIFRKRISSKFQKERSVCLTI